MNTRLQQFLSAENISQAQFADKIGVARASVSHILAGRNKPGFDFIERMARAYPTLSLDWLINGRGRMYKTTEETVSKEPRISPQADEQMIGNLFPDEPTSSDSLGNSSPFRPSPAPAVTLPASNLRVKSHKGDGSGKISRIIVLYSDGSYQELK